MSSGSRLASDGERTALDSFRLRLRKAASIFNLHICNFVTEMLISPWTGRGPPVVSLEEDQTPPLFSREGVQLVITQQLKDDRELSLLKCHEKDGVLLKSWYLHYYGVRNRQKVCTN